MNQANNRMYRKLTNNAKKGPTIGKENKEDNKKMLSPILSNKPKMNIA